MRRRAILVAATLLAAKARAEPAGPAPLVASFSILADMLECIGGPAVSVTAIVGPDRDAHGFAPRASDQRALLASRAAFANGLGFDPWIDRMVGAAGFQGPFIRAAEGISGPAGDPHAWQNLGNASAYAGALVAGLSQAIPAEEEGFRTRARQFIGAAAALDAWVRAEIAKVPRARRKVVTSHDAFGHFAAAYGVTFLAPLGISTESEPSAAAVARLIRQIREEGIRAVFVESMASPRLVEQLAREAGVRVRGRLYADALSGPDGPAPTWFAMFRHNVPLLVQAMLA